MGQIKAAAMNFKTPFYVIHKNELDDNYKKLIVSDDKKLLKGFILIGDIKRAGIYTRLIREKVPLDTIDFDEMIEKLEKSLA